MTVFWDDSPHDGGRKHLSNTGKLQLDYTVQHPRTQSSSYSPQWGPEISPNIVCFPSSHCVGASVIKNWEPFVFGPEFAMDNVPAPENEIHKC
jgi:hypothetical protein